MKRSTLPLLVTVLSFVWGVTPALALIEVHPRVAVQEEYNDNIYLEADNRARDFITTVSPGVTLRWPTDLLNLDLDYGFYFQKYGTNNQEDQTSIADTQRGKGTLTLFPDRNFSVIASDEYSKVYIDPRGPMVDENNFVNKTNLNQLLVHPQYRWRTSPTFEALFGYTYEDLNYQAEEGDDARGHIGSVELHKQLGRDFNARLLYEIERRSNKWTDDYLRQMLAAGFSRQFSRRFGVDAQAGAAKIDFKHVDANDTTHFIGDFSANYALTSLLGSTLHYGESMMIATIDGLYAHRQADGRLTYGSANTGPGQNHALATFSLIWSRDNYIQVDRTDRSLGGAVDLRMPLGRYVALLLGGSYSILHYRPETEKTNRFGVGAGVEYRVRHLVVALNYLYRENNSDIDINDYKNNLVDLTVTLQF